MSVKMVKFLHFLKRLVKGKQLPICDLNSKELLVADRRQSELGLRFLGKWLKADLRGRYFEIMVVSG